jgi:hypothetical protein
MELQVKDKVLDMKKLEQDMRDVERNETECRTQM